MRINLTTIVPFILVCVGISFAAPALAKGDYTKRNITKVNIELGSLPSGEMYMKPKSFQFETGKAYVLIINNVDTQKHELSLEGLGERSFTRKIQINDSKGNLISEIKGGIREVEVGPGYTAEWYIVPLQPLEDGEIICGIEGHLELGMHAKVSIK